MSPKPGVYDSRSQQLRLAATYVAMVMCGKCTVLAVMESELVCILCLPLPSLDLYEILFYYLLVPIL